MDNTFEEKNSNRNAEDIKEQRIQENITKWQLPHHSLAPLTDEDLDIIYQISDRLKEEYYETQKEETNINNEKVTLTDDKIFLHSNISFIKRFIEKENEVTAEILKEFFPSHDRSEELALQFSNLFSNTEFVIDSLANLEKKYNNVANRTDSLHTVSEQLMKCQRILKENKKSLKERLHYFIYFRNLSDDLNKLSSRINSESFLEVLEGINSALKYLNQHVNYKESKIYIAKYENLLSKAIILIRSYVTDVINAITKEVSDPDNTVDLLTLKDSNSGNKDDNVFSIYYGKFQGAAAKVKLILNYIEEESEEHDSYSQLLNDAQQIYFTQRASLIMIAVTKALAELKIKHKKDHSMLFRTSALFIVQICQDEASCFHCFFSKESQQLQDYLRGICQCLYDSLRPSLISINHLEILTELCNILRNELLVDHVSNNENLDRFVEIIRQLLQDVEERLIFRTHIFFQHDLSSYEPSPGDLAYPEKLEQMENIAEEINEGARSRLSSVSLESQEVATINAGHIGQFRSYTGNSPADLHGMWYPTVKRTLVCLSRLYFALDRETFQGLAQEALVTCVKTIDDAANKIITRKGPIDGRLFQIKHLLILREQIAPFQVDFTVKEVSLDFSSIKNAAYGLIQKRNKLFSLSSNNALLEFLLEGTPKVKEYLVDSRKEIDKHLKASCEMFIGFCTKLLIGNITNWLEKAEEEFSNKEKSISLKELEFGKPDFVAKIINNAQKNIKSKLPTIQRSMQLYLANRETEFILLKPVKNNIISAFIQLQQILTKAQYTSEDHLVMACPTPEQINVLICSVSLISEHDTLNSREDVN